MLTPKRKAGDMLAADETMDVDIYDFEPEAKRQSSIATTATTATTPSSIITNSTRPTSSHSAMETDEDWDDACSSEATIFQVDGAQDGLDVFGGGLVPPKNLGRVMDGVYRSAFPQPENLPYLKTLGLKTILTLVAGPYSDGHEAFVQENGIQHFQVAIEPNKSPFVTITHCSISFALGVMMDKSNYPLLVHCNKGKHRTGCVVGCFRKILGWDLSDILVEYNHYAGPKARVLDERYLELFEERSMLWLARKNGFLPPDEPARTESPIGALTVASRLRS